MLARGWWGDGQHVIDKPDYTHKGPGMPGWNMRSTLIHQTYKAVAPARFVSWQVGWCW